MTLPQENGDYAPSLVSEALSQTEQAGNHNYDINLLKDVAAQVYIGESACFILSSRLTERHISRRRNHNLSSWDVLLGNGLLSQSAEEGSR